MSPASAIANRRLGRGARRATGRLFVVSSPSGGGKTTLVEALLKRRISLRRSVSITTRPPRPGERHGSHYRFVSLRTFTQLRGRGGLLEWAQVHGSFYGTPRVPIARALAAGHDVVLSIDVQGARQIKRRFGARAVLIFVLPPSLDDLRHRLIRRRTDAPEAIRLRLREARRELACATWYDYAIVNHRLETAVEELTAIVMAERLRVVGASPADRAAK